MKHDLLMMGPMHGRTMAVLEATYNVHKAWLAADPQSFFPPIADRITAAATTAFRGMDAATMDKLPKLKAIVHFGVGVDSVDVQGARQRGITITNTPDVLTEDVADLALALLLATVRQVVHADRFVRDGRWLKGPMPLTASVQGKTAGILGFGRIGKAIAKRCEAFNMRIAYHGPNRKADIAFPYFADLVALARQCDFLIAACPGGESTRGLVSRAVIEALGPEGVFVNISRGSVADEAALVAALAGKTLGGAGLDVFADEPHVPEALIALDNVVLLPHVGSATHPTRQAMGQLVIDNLAAHFAGRDLLTPYQ